MEHDRSMMADEDAEFIREVMLIMIVWTIVVVLAGIVLVALQGSFASIFAFGVGL